MIFVFSYEREQMLRDLVSTISEPYLILDDGSEFTLDHMAKFPHEGKEGFWKKWQYAFSVAKESKDDLFIFLPSDFQNVQWNEIKRLHEKYKDVAYLYNIIDDGRKWCWIEKHEHDHDEDSLRVYFTDCGFFCNRRALKAIDWRVRRVDPKRFEGRPNISSGVGQNFTFQFYRAGVLMLKPRKSLAYHGDHPSTMHPEHRAKTPLISR